MKNEKSSEYISRTSKDYAIYTCEQRAIPRVTDGLKTGQRYAIWVLRNKAEQIKTMAAGALTTYENLYTHGDTSINDAISRLAAPYLNNLCFLDGIGAFGSKLSPDSFGAPRYTSVKRAKSTQELLLQDLNIVPLMENYDGSNFSAKTFLPIVPTVLLNGISGIAVGWSTEILPHKLNDLIDGCIDVLDGKDVKKLIPYYNLYDIDVGNLEDNSWVLKGKVKIDDSWSVSIKELPPGLKVEKFREFLDKLEEDGLIRDYVDKSTKHVNIIISLKREFLKNKTEDELIEFFKLKTRITERMVVIGFNDKMKVYETHNELFQDFVKWRLGWYRVRFENLLKNAQDDLNYYKALEQCFIQELPNNILLSTNKQSVRNLVQDITKEFNLSEEQIEKIVSLPSYRWAKDCLEEIKEKIIEISVYIDVYQGILADENEIKKIYKQELSDLKKVKF